MQPAEGDQPLAESQQFRVPPHERPVEPSQRAVVAIGVVVAELRAADLVAHQQHRNPLAEEEQGQGVPDLPPSQGVDLRIVRLAFDAAVPGVIFVEPSRLPSPLASLRLTL